MASPFSSSNPNPFNGNLQPQPPPLVFGQSPKTSDSSFSLDQSQPQGFSVGSAPKFQKKNRKIRSGSRSTATPPKDAVRDDGEATASANPPETASKTPAIHLEFMLEKKSKRVVFAESNKDFVDLLFSFLTLPIGSILRILGEMLPPTSLACINNLRKSVVNLDARAFRTQACKEMLLSPRRSSESQCKNIALKIADSLEPSKTFYFCTNSICRREGKVRLSDFPNVLCHCGQVMSQLAKEKTSNEARDEMEGVFLKGVTDMFLMSDDLRIMPGSSFPSLVLMKAIGISDANELETECLTVRSEEILELLRLTLISKTPLTHWIWLKKGIIDLIEVEQGNVMVESQGKKCKTNDPRKIMLKLFASKSKNKILYAECAEDFVDFLFSILTLPLGSIVQLLDGSSSLVSIDNLYRSVKILGSDYYLKSEELKDMLMHPKLAPFHVCKHQLFDVEETSHPLYSLRYLDSETEWYVSPVASGPEENDIGTVSICESKIVRWANYQW